MTALLRVLARPFVFVFLKIAEPRVIRLIQFGIYVALSVAGGYIVSTPPTAFQNVLGITLVYIFGSFLLLGGVLGAVAVLPGVWWLERMGVVAVWTGLGMFIVIVFAVGASAVALATAFALAGSMLIRWFEIRRYELAPRAA